MSNDIFNGAPINWNVVKRVGLHALAMFIGTFFVLWYAADWLPALKGAGMATGTYLLGLSQIKPQLRTNPPLPTKPEPEDMSCADH